MRGRARAPGERDNASRARLAPASTPNQFIAAAARFRTGADRSVAAAAGIFAYRPLLSRRAWPRARNPPVLSVRDFAATHGASPDAMHRRCRESARSRAVVREKWSSVGTRAAAEALSGRTSGANVDDCVAVRASIAVPAGNIYCLDAISSKCRNRSTIRRRTERMSTNSMFNCQY